MTNHAKKVRSVTREMADAHKALDVTTKPRPDESPKAQPAQAEGARRNLADDGCLCGSMRTVDRRLARLERRVHNLEVDAGYDTPEAKPTPPAAPEPRCPTCTLLESSCCCFSFIKDAAPPAPSQDATRIEVVVLPTEAEPKRTCAGCARHDGVMCQWLGRAVRSDQATRCTAYAPEPSQDASEPTVPSDEELREFFDRALGSDPMRSKEDWDHARRATFNHGVEWGRADERANLRDPLEMIDGQDVHDAAFTLRADRDELEGRLERANADVARLRGQVRTLDADLFTVKAEADKLRAENTRLGAAMVELTNKGAAEIGRLKSELANTQDLNADIREQNRRLINELAEEKARAESARIASKMFNEKQLACIAHKLGAADGEDAEHAARRIAAKVEKLKGELSAAGRTILGAVQELAEARRARDEATAKERARCAGVCKSLAATCWTARQCGEEIELTNP